MPKEPDMMMDLSSETKFVTWLKQVGCKSELSSAYNPASNGLAEAGVKNVKTLLKKCI